MINQNIQARGLEKGKWYRFKCRLVFECAPPINEVHLPSDKSKVVK